MPRKRLFLIVRYLGLANVLKITKTSGKFKLIDSLQKCDLIKESETYFFQALVMVMYSQIQVCIMAKDASAPQSSWAGILPLFLHCSGMDLHLENALNNCFSQRPSQVFDTASKRNCTFSHTKSHSQKHICETRILLTNHPLKCRAQEEILQDFALALIWILRSFRLTLEGAS